MTAPLRVLSLHAPYCSLAVAEIKVAETRSWDPGWTGRVALHQAARKPTKAEQREHPTGWAMHQDEAGWWCTVAGGVDAIPMPLGFILGTADLAGCWPTERVLFDDELEPGTWVESGPVLVLSWDQERLGDYSEGRYVWPLANVEALAEAVPFKGGQRFTKTWRPPAPEAGQ